MSVKHLINKNNEDNSNITRLYKILLPNIYVFLSILFLKTVHFILHSNIIGAFYFL